MWKDSETNIDLLDFDYLVDVTKKIILNNNLTPSTIGVYGDWGSGKSSLMEMIMNDISKEANVLCVKFNGWLFEGYEDAKIALIGSILDEINKERRPVAKAKKILKNLYDNTDFIKFSSKLAKYGIDFLLTGGILSVTDITIETIKNALVAKGKQIEEKEIKSIFKALKSKEVRKSVQTFHDDFKSLLKEAKIQRLVIFIDELDRCRHETILETLEAIRLFLFAEGTSFVIGADERQIQYAVKMKYPTIEGNQIDIGKEYLEKLIQYPIRIPQLGRKEVEFYIMCLLFEKSTCEKELNLIHEIIKEKKDENFLDFELTYDLIKEKSEDLAEKSKDTISLAKQISSVLAKNLNGNPRHCKRFLNTMELRIQMGNHRGIMLDRKVLAKIMLVEYFKEIFYRRLAELQSKDNGKPQELNLIENGKWDDAEELNMWKNDSWIIDWIKIEPKLSDIDLRPYFYFSRESIKNISIIQQKNLSRDANQILEKLLSGGDSAREDAIKISSIINEYEANTILSTLVAKIESSSEIEKSLFQSFIEWGSSRTDIHIETVAALERFPVNKIKVSFIPLITILAKKLNNKTKIIELYLKWQTDEHKLKSAIENELNNLQSK
jgi:predicted KAP-like P-loop ATPase